MMSIGAEEIFVTWERVASSFGTVTVITICIHCTFLQQPMKYSCVVAD